MTAEEARDLRDEDAFDVEAVARWLSGIDRTLAGVPDVGQFPGGASNLTYLLRYPHRDLVLRRPPLGVTAASAHDMRREFRVQSALAGPYGLVPAMVGFCDDPAVLGSDFYVMAKVEGTILRRSLPEQVGREQARALGLHAVDSLVALHGVDVEAAGLAGLGRGPGYVARQVSGWSDRYVRAQTPDVPDFAAVRDWLAAEQPPDVAMCLIHNDFRLDNLVLDDDFQVVAVLDWEMATVGDPLMDLGGALAYWVEAGDDDVMRASRRQPTDAVGMPTRAEVVRHYCAATGRSVGSWPFYEVFGLFRLAVICQQIYARFVAGSTTNPAFAHFGLFVGYLEQRCRAVAGLAPVAD